MLRRPTWRMHQAWQVGEGSAGWPWGAVAFADCLQKGSLVLQRHSMVASVTPDRTIMSQFPSSTGCLG